MNSKVVLTIAFLSLFISVCRSVPLQYAPDPVIGKWKCYTPENLSKPEIEFDSSGRFFASFLSKELKLLWTKEKFEGHWYYLIYTEGNPTPSPAGFAQLKKSEEKEILTLTWGVYGEVEFERYPEHSDRIIYPDEVVNASQPAGLSENHLHD